MDSTYLTNLCEASNSVLLVIDLQGKIFNLAFNHDAVKARAGQLLRLADLFKVPVILTEQYPEGLGGTDPDLLDRFEHLETDTHLIKKTSFGCCGDGGFVQALTTLSDRVGSTRGPGEPDRPLDVVICGIETHICVQQTALELLRRGYRVVVLQDATGGRIPEYHEAALERFRQCGAIITNFESLAFEWARTKDHAHFKAISKLVKDGG